MQPTNNRPAQGPDPYTEPSDSNDTNWAATPINEAAPQRQYDQHSDNTAVQVEPAPGYATGQPEAVPSESVIGPQPALQPFPGITPNTFVAEKKFWTKRKKLVAGMLVGLLLLAGGAGAAAYTIYNNPDKVVGDAIYDALTAKSGTAKGTATILPEGEQGSMNIKYDMAGNTDSFKADLALEADIPPMKFDISGSAMSDATNNYYFKVNNAKQIIQNIFGFGAESVQNNEPDQGLQKLIALLDDKWVKIDSSDITGSMPAEEKRSYECSQQLIKDLSSDPSLIDGAAEVYKKNVFIKASTLPSDDIMLAHYKLAIDQRKAESFVDAFKQTQLYERLVKCDKQFDINKQDVSQTVKTINEQNIEVWVDKLSHQFSRVFISGTDDGSSYTIRSDVSFNGPVDIAVPSDTTPFKDVMAEFNNVTGGMLQSYEYEDENPAADVEDHSFTDSGARLDAVLGARAFDVLQLLR